MDIVDLLQAEADKHDGEIDEIEGGGGYTATFPSASKAIAAARDLARVHKGPINGPVKNQLEVLTLKGLL